MLAGTMKPAPASKPASCKPAQAQQIQLKITPTAYGAKRTRPLTPTNGSSPRPKFEALLARYDRVTDLLAREANIRLEIKHIRH